MPPPAKPPMKRADAVGEGICDVVCDRDRERAVVIASGIAGRESDESWVSDVCVNVCLCAEQ
jgi:hypothetical protein